LSDADKIGRVKIGVLLYFIIWNHFTAGGGGGGGNSEQTCPLDLESPWHKV